MTEFSKEVREEAARRANAAHLDDPDWTADNIANDWIGRTLCQAVLDGLLHVDPAELDKARWESAKAEMKMLNHHENWFMVAQSYRRLVREGSHPELVDPVERVAREVAKRHNRENMPVSLDDVAADAIRAWIEREAGQ